MDVTRLLLDFAHTEGHIFLQRPSADSSKAASLNKLSPQLSSSMHGSNIASIMVTYCVLPIGKFPSFSARRTSCRPHKHLSRKSLIKWTLRHGVCFQAAQAKEAGRGHRNIGRRRRRNPTMDHLLLRFIALPSTSGYCKLSVPHQHQQKKADFP